MEARLKSIDSTVEKLQRRGLPVSLAGMRDLTDIAGIRVICNYVDDLYTMADLLLRQDDIELIARKDYIANPKESGYRSLHLVVLVPVFQAARTERMPVEIQLRTIAQDTWASLEHELKYKKQGDISEEDRAELITCAKILADVDERMQKIHHKSILGSIAQG
jgi:putative GTP pyrophosphokinase